MWIIIESAALISLLISYYLITDYSAIVIDKKNHRIIVVHKSPPTIITFSDLIAVDLIVNGGKRIATKTQSAFNGEPDSVCLKIVIANVENPVYVYFTNAEGKKNRLSFKSPEKSAQSLHKKLCEIISLYSPARRISVSQSAEFQLRKLSEFRNNIVGQSAS
jgi:hypothetical protein